AVPPTASLMETVLAPAAGTRPEAQVHLPFRRWITHRRCPRTRSAGHSRQAPRHWWLPAGPTGHARGQRRYGGSIERRFPPSRELVRPSGAVALAQMRLEEIGVERLARRPCDELGGRMARGLVPHFFRPPLVDGAEVAGPDLF